MSRVLRSVRKRKKGRTLGAVDVIDREGYAELEVDAKVELIRSLIPLGLLHIEELLDEEVTALAGERYARKDLSVSNSLSGRHWELDQVPAVGDGVVARIVTGPSARQSSGTPRVPLWVRAHSSCLGAQLAISVNNCPPPRDPRSRMTSFKRTQRKYVQKAYRVRNWREYETGLRARGSLTVWLGLTDGKLANWNSPRPTRRKPGRQRKYSNHAIETTVTLGLVFGLASRQTEGFLRSLLTLLNLDNDVPDHSTISRRKARLGKVASYERRTVKPVLLLIDSSGLSVHVGQLRTPPKARDYRKLHLAVDEQTSDVVACELTSKRARDASRVASLVGQIERPIASAKADAAYDTGDVYKTLENHRAHRSPKVLIPPRKGAQLALDSAGNGLDPISWTRSERWRRCPEWQQPHVGGHAGNSVTSSGLGRSGWCWKRGRRSAPSPASWILPNRPCGNGSSGRAPTAAGAVPV